MGIYSIGVYSQKIEDLPLAAIPQATDLLIIDQADATRSITVAALLMGPPAPWVGLFPDGTAAVPGGAFWNDLDVGFWRPGADILGFTAGGVEGFRMTETAGTIVNAFTGSATVSGTTTTNLLVADSIDANYIDTDTLLVNDIAAFDSIYAAGMSMFDSTVSIGGWGYTGEHIVMPESSSNTNPLLGIYGMVDYSATAGKVFAGTYSRLLAMTTNQANLSTMVGTESQFRLRDVDIGSGVHAGLWAYAEQSGTSALTGGGTFDAISATIESEAGFSAGATEHVTGITIDGSIHASATINASTNFSGLYIKSNGKDWFDGIRITGATNDIRLKNGATINNGDANTLTIVEATVAVTGSATVSGTATTNLLVADSTDFNYTDTDTLLVNNNASVSGMLTVTGTITGATLVSLKTAATVTIGSVDSCKNIVYFNNDADVIDFTLPGAAAGLIVMFYDIAGGVITIDPVDDTDTIYLNGTSVGAGDAIDSPGAVGDFICLMAIDAARWVTVGRSGTWVDGGAD